MPSCPHESTGWINLGAVIWLQNSWALAMLWLLSSKAPLVSCHFFSSSMPHGADPRIENLWSHMKFVLWWGLKDTRSKKYRQLVSTVNIQSAMWTYHPKVRLRTHIHACEIETAKQSFVLQNIYMAISIVLKSNIHMNKYIIYCI